jgi:hypothetical protein
MKKLLALFITLAALALPIVATAQTGGSNLTRVAGRYNAANYAHWSVPIAQGNTSTGTATITLAAGSITLPDGRVIVPFNTTTPISVGTGSDLETVTPTTVTNCYSGAGYGVCTITASFSNTHTSREPVQTSTFGLAEAISDAGSAGGLVTVDSSFAGTTSTITGATANTSVWIEDVRTGAPVWFGEVIGGTTYSAQSNDMVGKVTLSGGAGSVAFSKTYTVAPDCVATDTTAAAATKASASTSTLTLAGTTTDVLSYRCSLVK